MAFTRLPLLETVFPCFVFTFHLTCPVEVRTIGDRFAEQSFWNVSKHNLILAPLRRFNNNNI